MNAVAGHHFRSRHSRFHLSRHVADRQKRLRYMLARLYQVMKRLQEEGYVRSFHVHDLRSVMAQQYGCNCGFVSAQGRSRRKFKFGVAISQRVRARRQEMYPHTPQLLLRYANEEVLYAEVRAFIQEGRG